MSEKPSPIDPFQRFALLVLGGEDPRRAPRSHAALACYRRCLAMGQPAPLIVVSGGAKVFHHAQTQRTDADAPSEAQHMAQLLRAAGVPNVHLALETQAHNTLGNIVLGTDMAQSRGIAPSRIVLVSDDFHLPRSRWLFQQVWGHGPLDSLGTGFAGSWWLRRREVLALAAQRWALMRAGLAAGDGAAHRQFVIPQNKKPPAP